VRNRSSGNSQEEDSDAITVARISVVIPVQSRVEYLAGTVATVLAQTQQPIEIIFSKNAASNTVNEEVRRLQQRYPQVQVVDSLKGSLSLVRNQAIAIAKGEFIAFLDDGDVWEKDKLEQQLNYAIRMGLDVVSCNYYEFSEDDQVLMQSRYTSGRDHSWLDELSVANEFAGGSSALVRKSVFKRVGWFDESMPSEENWDMWWRMALAKEKIGFMEDVLVGYRKITRNIPTNKNLKLQGELLHLAKVLGASGIKPELTQQLYEKLRDSLNHRLQIKQQPTSFISRVKRKIQDCLGYGEK
jgi:glycosyltransferase involved in cell wall biosynthesis